MELKFGRLKIIERLEDKRFCRCLCDCGKEHVAFYGNVKRGLTKSCGCLRAEDSRAKGKRCITHGKKGSKVYRVWQQMKDRCLNVRQVNYQDYGGRGINVSESWLNFVNFYKDMGDVPEGMQLDRIDNNRGYSKDNCRWSSRKEQANNRRSNLRLEMDGSMHTLREWCDMFGFTSVSGYSLVRERLKRGWSLRESLENKK